MKNFITLNVAMQKIRNIITIRRVLKCSFALLLIAGRLPFLTATGKNYVLMDFGGAEITQEGVLEKVQEYKKGYIKKCDYFTGEFKKLNEGKTSKPPTNEELVRDYLMPFHEFIFSDDWDTRPLEHYRPCFGDKKTDQDRGLHIAKFFTALKALKSGSFDKDTEKHEKILYEELTKFVKGTLSEEFQIFSDQVQNNTEVKELQMNFILQNGIVSVETSRELFNGFKEPFSLVFWGVKGTFCAGEQLKSLVVIMRFVNSELQFVPRCFERAPLLEELDTTGQTSFLVFGENSFSGCQNLKDIKVVDKASHFAFGKNSFSGCPKLQSPFRAGNNIMLMGGDDLLSAFEGCECIAKKSVQRVALKFYYDSIMDGSLKEPGQAEIYINKNQLSRLYLIDFHSFKSKEAKSENESLRKKCDTLEKENTELRESKKFLHESFEARVHPFVDKNNKLQESIEKMKEELEKMSKELSGYKKRVAQCEKIIEEDKQKLEESRQSWDRERLHRLQLVGENKELQDKIKVLEKDKEELEEEISTLEDDKEKLKGKIETISTLEMKITQLEQRLAEVEWDKKGVEGRSAVKDIKLKEKKKKLEEKDEEIKALKNERSELMDKIIILQREIKDMKTSQWYVVTTSAEFTEPFYPNQTSAYQAPFYKGKEEPKEETKKEPRFYSNKGQKGGNQTSAYQAQNINKKNFYPNTQKGRNQTSAYQAPFYKGKEEPKEVTEETSQEEKKEPFYPKGKKGKNGKKGKYVDMDEYLSIKKK